MVKLLVAFVTDFPAYPFSFVRVFQYEKDYVNYPDNARQYITVLLPHFESYGADPLKENKRRTQYPCKYQHPPESSVSHVHRFLSLIVISMPAHNKKGLPEPAVTPFGITLHPFGHRPTRISAGRETIFIA